VYRAVKEKWCWDKCEASFWIDGVYEGSKEHGNMERLSMRTAPMLLDAYAEAELLCNLVFGRAAVALLPKAADGGTGGLVGEASAEQVVAEAALEGGERERRERMRSAVSGAVSGARFVEVGQMLVG